MADGRGQPTCIPDLALQAYGLSEMDLSTRVVALLKGQLTNDSQAVGSSSGRCVCVGERRETLDPTSRFLPRAAETPQYPVASRQAEARFGVAALERERERRSEIRPLTFESLQPAEQISSPPVARECALAQRQIPVPMAFEGGISTHGSCHAMGGVLPDRLEHAIAHSIPPPPAPHPPTFPHSPHHFNPRP